MTYLDTQESPKSDLHEWRTFTEARLKWLYGPMAVADRYLATKADLQAWNRLGRREAA